MRHDGTSMLAVYAIFKNNRPVKIGLCNSEYHTSGPRPTSTFTLTGITSHFVTAKRLTAAATTSQQDQGSFPSFGGQQFANVIR